VVSIWAGGGVSIAVIVVVVVDVIVLVVVVVLLIVLVLTSVVVTPAWQAGSATKAVASARADSQILFFITLGVTPL